MDILEQTHSSVLNAFSGHFEHFDEIILESFAEPLLNSLDLELISIHDQSFTFKALHRISEIISSHTEKWVYKIWIPLIHENRQLVTFEQNYPFQSIHSDKRLQKRSMGSYFSSLASSIMQTLSTLAAKTRCNWVLSKLGSVLIGSVLAGYFIVTLLFFKGYARDFYEYIGSNSSNSSNGSSASDGSDASSTLNASSALNETSS